MLKMVPPIPEPSPPHAGAPGGLGASTASACTALADSRLRALYSRSRRLRTAKSNPATSLRFVRRTPLPGLAVRGARLVLATAAGCFREPPCQHFEEPRLERRDIVKPAGLSLPATRAYYQRSVFMIVRAAVRMVAIYFLAASASAFCQAVEFSAFVSSASLPGGPTGLADSPPTAVVPGTNEWQLPIGQETVWFEPDCGAVPMIKWRKGGGNIPWASEQHFLEDGRWKGMSEFLFDGYGDVTRYRVFRDMSDPDPSTWRKGVGRFPEAVPTNGSTVSQPIGSYVEEYWGDLIGCSPTGCVVRPSCNGVVNIPLTGTVFLMETHFVPRASSGEVVYDCRVSPCSGTPTPVDIYEHVEYWQSNRETYRFARWTDPVTGQEGGLGLYSWSRMGPAFAGCRTTECTNYAPYVVPSGSLSIPCATCPDP